MKKWVIWLTGLFMICLLMGRISVMEVKAAGESVIDIGSLLGDVKDKISEAVSKLDTETVKEMFDFVEEKLRDGSLKTEEGLADAVQEGEDKFGITISEADAKKVVETMEKLESMGFSGEYVLEKAETLYDKYGADFVEHADELIAGAVEDAVAGAAESFFQNLWESTKNFFQNLFSGL